MIVFVVAGLLTFLFVFLSMMVVKRRKALGIPLGDGGNIQMQRVIRAHSNFCEYAPFSVMMLFLLEYWGINKGEILSLGVMIVLGRYMHSYGLIFGDSGCSGGVNMYYRKSGMQLTLIAILYCAFRLIHIAILSRLHGYI